MCRTFNSPRPAACLLLLLLTATGCLSTQEPDLVVYAALDREFSEPILNDYGQQQDIQVSVKYDTEAAKTVGLANAIIAEADRPRCDVFWNNEILNSLRLQQRGLLQAYQSPQAENYPEMYRSPEGLWYGFAGRARVLIVNTERLQEDEYPRSIHDLADERWQGKCGMAKPLFGTTATHAACLFASWGDEKAKQYYTGLKQNQVQIMAGNKDAALAVANGQLDFAITDTDDAMVCIDQGFPVKIVYPDREEDQLGTLFIPNTLCIIRDCPHPDQARKLVDYLLQPRIEARLAEGPSAQIPLGKGVEAKTRVETPETVKAMPVDFNQAVQKWDTAAEFLRKTFGA